MFEADHKINVFNLDNKIHTNVIRITYMPIRHVILKIIQNCYAKWVLSTREKLVLQEIFGEVLLTKNYFLSINEVQITCLP